jgi:hypothetical protein
LKKRWITLAGDDVALAGAETVLAAADDDTFLGSGCKRAHKKANMQTGADSNQSIDVSGVVVCDVIFGLESNT